MGLCVVHSNPSHRTLADADWEGMILGHLLNPSLSALDQSSWQDGWQCLRLLGLSHPKEAKPGVQRLVLLIEDMFTGSLHAEEEERLVLGASSLPISLPGKQKGKTASQPPLCRQVTRRVGPPHLAVSHNNLSKNSCQAVSTPFCKGESAMWDFSAGACGP